ncbi:MAG: hypothetical protein O7D91_06455 [Planctomycetota bacterium]|nr:hypothetical protein [Planctomycetota bacterium]
MTSPINTALLRITKRAEVSARERLIQTFVDVGPLFTLLSGQDHQILFGRRGTGKTHALNYLADAREKAGDVVAMVDLRNVGSSAGLYGDQSVPLAERATRLLVDVLCAIHDTLLEFFIEHSEALDLSQAGPVLDELADSITQVKVVGQVELQTQSTESRGSQTSTSGGFAVSASSLSVGGESEDVRSASSGESKTVRRSGEERLYVNFGRTAAAFRQIADRLSGHRLWILLDEWSSVPLILQPYLADLLRRALFAVPNATVKIGAIEQRSIFLDRRDTGDYVGIELGADASADINLDDFMVFDNDADRAKEFFKNLVARHVTAAADQLGSTAQIPSSSEGIIRQAFTETRAVEEFVRSCEGVPRDAIHILGLAAQSALAERISVQHIRVAARNWYQRDKETAASSNEEAHSLLHWIIDEVIGQRRARAFLLLSGTTDRLIDSLYDSRVLHLLKRSVSTHDRPGIRYDVYKIDYGCYVDLISTAREPQGLLPAGGSDEGDAQFVDVPPDDYRSIRRAILDLAEFYRQRAG